MDESDRADAGREPPLSDCGMENSPALGGSDDEQPKLNNRVTSRSVRAGGCRLVGVEIVLDGVNMCMKVAISSRFGPRLSSIFSV
jgi:hypothetical protein